jgi:integrase
MSSVFRRSGIYYAKVKCSSGQWVAKTCETRDSSLAKSIGRMVDELAHRGKQSWDLLDSVVQGRLSLSRLYAAYASNALEALRDQLSDVDLSPIVDEWLTAISGRLSADTVAHYRVHVRSLIPADTYFPRSTLTFERLYQWLARIPHASGTRRKYHAAMSGFCQYLRSRSIIRSSPMQDVKAPPAGPSRLRYLDHVEVLRIVEALEEPYRTIVAFMHASGVEVSAVLRLKRREVDFSRREVRAHGTKTKTRDRVAVIEDWAIPFLKNHAKDRLPNALLFPGINRWTVSDKHRDACTALDIEDYQLRDARHTFAVRAIRAGAPFEVVAQQLGHTDTSMVVRVYGRFRPSAEELRSWHRVAVQQDLERQAR